MLTGMLVLIAALVMVAPVSADPWIGGDPRWFDIRGTIPGRRGSF